MLEHLSPNGSAAEPDRASDAPAGGYRRPMRTSAPAAPDPRRLAWLVPVALAGYLLAIHPAAGTARVPYPVALLGPSAVLIGSWAIAARGPVARAARSSGTRMAALLVGLVVVAAALAYLVVDQTAAVGLTHRRRLEYTLVVALVAAAGAVLGLRTRRLPSATELVIALGLAAAADMDLYVTSYGFHRDFGIYVRAGRAFLDGTPVYTEVPLTKAPTDPALDPFVYPPLTLPFFAPLAILPLPVAHAMWFLVTLAATVFSLRRFGIRWSWLPLLLLWPPIVLGLWVGNVDMLALAAFAAAPWYPALLGLPPLVKLQLGVTGLWLVRERRFRSLVAAVALAAGLALVTLPIVGLDPWGAWLRALAAFAQTVGNMPPITGVALARYLPAAVAVLLGLVAVLVALRWRGRDGLADLGLASLAVSPTLYPHGFPIGLPAFLRLRALAFWSVLALTSTFYRPQSWWLLVLVGLAGPWLPWLVRPRSSDGPHPLGTDDIWPGAPADIEASHRAITSS
jgi:hypothetical protein